jgi:RNA-directed DNA polymerase
VPDLPPHLYLKRASELGRDLQVSQRAVALTQQLRSRGAEPVYTLGHLAQLNGAPSRYLREVISRSLDPYLDIDRPKRDGRTRPIASPEPMLMDVQRWILHNILAACDLHRCSWAYSPGRSVVACAQSHMGARWLIKLDVHNFFGSIDERKVFAIFHGLGYTRLLSFELARLCTRTAFGDHGRRVGQAPYLAMPRGSLPQGAPTSGALANAAMHDLDEKLVGFAERRGLVYTRYSDDIVFSATGTFTRPDAAALINDASSALRGSGLEVHRRKTKVVPPGARKIVLGLTVLDDAVALPREFKRRIEVHVRGVHKFGLVEHARHRKFRSVLSMVEHIDGCIAFARSVDRAFADRLRTEWGAVLRQEGFPSM